MAAGLHAPLLSPSGHHRQLDGSPLISTGRKGLAYKRSPSAPACLQAYVIGPDISPLELPDRASAPMMSASNRRTVELTAALVRAAAAAAAAASAARPEFLVKPAPSVPDPIRAAQQTRKEAVLQDVRRWKHLHSLRDAQMRNRDQVEPEVAIGRLFREEADVAKANRPYSGSERRDMIRYLSAAVLDELAGDRGQVEPDVAIARLFRDPTCRDVVLANARALAAVNLHRPSRLGTEGNDFNVGAARH